MRFALAPILLFAALLRLWNLPARGLIYWDESKFALEGLRLQWALVRLFELPAGPVLGRAVGTAKPGHALLIGLAYTILGVRDYAPLVLNALCSVLAVGVLYAVAEHLFDCRVALLAAFLLAASQYDVIYARSALSESDANLILLLGVLVWVRGYGPDRQTRDLRPIGSVSCLGGAALFGLAFTVNYRVLPYLAALIALDVVWSWRTESRAAASRRAALWVCGVCLAPLAWEAIDLLALSRGVHLFRADSVPHSSHYLAEVLYQLHGGKQASTHLSALPYLQWFVSRQSWPLLLLTVGGLSNALRGRRFPWLVPTAAILPPFLLFIFAPFVVPRNLTPMLPFSCLLAAAALVALVGLLRAPRQAIAVVLAAAAVFGGFEAVQSWRLSGLRSGFAVAAQYVSSHSGRALTSSELMVFYLRGPGTTCRSPTVPWHQKYLRPYVDAGYRLAVLENHHTSPVTDYIRRTMHRVKRIPAYGSLDLGESLISSENGSPPDPYAKPEHVDIYDLSPLGDGHVVNVPPCNEDQVS